MSHGNDINEHHIKGRLGKDAEYKLAGGNPLCKFSVATEHSYNGKNYTSWHNVTCWGELAEQARDLRKGAQVELWGRVSTRSYEQNGQKKYMTETVAEKILGGNSDNSTSRANRSTDTSEDFDPFS